MAGLRDSILLGIGNPLLDIQAEVAKPFLDKYSLKENDAILAESQHMPMFKELAERKDVQYIPGGATQNALRVAQWILKRPKIVSFMGCIGKDSFGDILKEKAVAAGVDVHYQIDPTTETGTCAALIFGDNRSLCANLAAANKFTIDHIEKEENKKLIEAADFYYIGGFFLTVCPPAIQSVAEAAATKNKLFAMNLSAPFLVDFFSEPMLAALPYVDLLFGNETEFAAFAVKHKLEVTGSLLTVCPPAIRSVAEAAATKNKLFAMNLSAPFLVDFFSEPMLAALPYVDLLFGNETEFAAFAVKHKLEVTGSLLTVCPPAIRSVAEAAATKNKLFAMNLSAPFLVDFFSEPMLAALPYVDLLFGNEIEFAAFAVKHKLEVTGSLLTVCPPAIRSVAEAAATKNKLFAMNLSAPFLVDFFSEPMLAALPYVDLLFGNETEFAAFAVKHKLEVTGSLLTVCPPAIRSVAEAAATKNKLFAMNLSAPFLVDFFSEPMLAALPYVDLLFGNEIEFATFAVKHKLEVTGSLLTVCPPAIQSVAEAAATKNKLFAMNLSASFLVDFFSEPMLAALPYVDLLFGNETEFAAFAVKHKLEVTGSLLTVCPPAIRSVAEAAATKNKLFAMNLSAPFLVDFFSEPMLAALPYVDLLFGNETEFAAFAVKHKLEVTGSLLTVCPPAIQSVAEAAATKNKLFAMNLSAPFLVDFFSEPMHAALPYVDLLFGNETEFAAFAVKHKLEVTGSLLTVCPPAIQSVVEAAATKNKLFAMNLSAPFLVDFFSEPMLAALLSSTCCSTTRPSSPPSPSSTNSR